MNYSYDNLNRITNILYDSNNVATYNYTGLENTSIVYDNNTSIIKGFDNLSRINSLNNGVNTYNYTYDDVNNITSDSIKNYLYDDIYRLTSVNETNSGTLLKSFNYDNVGNRINNFNSKTGSGANYDYETNILNQYTSLSGSISSYELQEIIEEIQTGSGEIQTITTYTGSIVTTNENTNFVYDNNGNLKNDGEKTFSYDYKNRLTKVESSSGIIVQYSYDVMNRRYLKQTEDKTTRYIYSNENILQEITTDETTTTTKDYINGIGIDDLISYEENNNTYYFHKNHLGSVEGITDSSGNLVVSYEYDSFGNFEITSGANSGNTRLYTGREYDSEIGLYYNRARYYNPELGRFISRDPIDISDDVNLYAYTKNNPVNFTDNLGLNSKKLITEKLIVSIFDSAMKDTGGFSLYQIYDGTRNSGPYDIKRNAFIEAQAHQNGGVISFNGVDVEPSNLGNLLFGMNTSNNYIPSFVARDILMSVEIDNAEIEGYGVYSKEIAKRDENSDSIWYDKGEEIYSRYRKATTIDAKIDIITNAIINTNGEYNKRSKLEQEKREYYFNLLNK
ncbi:MAG: hypothetical protein PHV23_00910 [Candidatus Gracilibacteria bacterium]|nr:hypothetical protein [Candidatus Gracilibacteria bacterium]